MRNTTSITAMIFSLIFLTLTIIVWANSTGRITGTITDKECGQPLAGATVQVVGTSLGAFTDDKGKYTIVAVAPGLYTLKVTSIGYTSIEIKALSVAADLTTEQSFRLEKSKSDLDLTITVRAEKDIIDKFQTDNRVSLKSGTIARKPVTSIDDLKTQAQGAVMDQAGNTHIRGGRSGKVAYIVEGTPLGDPLGGQSSTSGAAMSAVVGSAPEAERKSIRRKPHGHTPVTRRPYEPPYEPPVYHHWNEYSGPAYDAMFFQQYGVNPFVNTNQDHLSTFSVDVDNASYVMARSYLERGSLPPADAVRVEEFINRFDYDYKPPGRAPFGVYVEGGPSRFGKDDIKLVKIGVKGREVSSFRRKPANLVFVIDCSGSMARENRIGLVKQSLLMLLNELSYKDQVGLVSFNGHARVVLPMTSLEDRRRIQNAIRQLSPGGSTNAAHGLQLGYQMADRHFRQGQINRVILCSDGVANAGTTDPEQLLRRIKKYADRGITLSTIGVGMGNYNDVLMEKLGDRGNGQYAYVDDIQEARRVFTRQATGMLQAIARDVKIQVDFNPDVVQSYRLLGYENRSVADNQFRNDNVDGGEIGAGHQATALYEVRLQARRSTAHIGTVFVRFKDPTGTKVREVNYVITTKDISDSFSACRSDFKLAAVAGEFAEILRNSYWARGSHLGDLLAVAQQTLYDYDGGASRSDVAELVELISKAHQLKDQLADW